MHFIYNFFFLNVTFNSGPTLDPICVFGGVFFPFVCVFGLFWRIFLRVFCMLFIAESYFHYVCLVVMFASTK